ncbi:DNA-binding of Mlu1-box binding protein MBP1 [Venustampulla echinocandica]|uniref:DNA-binding of Mlu1-box binding protein MBP1 n=1 Tax=Venustampulla echinocandica TaxID=2656787 RepID=A0A370TRN2_9HELO|nr:DNA-binding of Mlu1-box binding protein MBP1 [Venustampulla echinocandica]RDL38158.1 DNA-binding of Mlu1-box binding protein MBP1 [Venustampulla echinocandica]
MVSKDRPFIPLQSSRNIQVYHQSPSPSLPRSALQPESSPSTITGAMYHPSQMSGPQSPPMHPHPNQAGGLQSYPPPHPESQQEPQPSNQYPQYSYDIQLKFPQQQENHQQHTQYPPPPQGLPLPSMSVSGLPPISQGGYPAPPPQEIAMDTTGQVAPPGSRPRVTATLWEDEGTLCFQVDVKGTCVARREDNHMINGTKLLNVAGMTRGRRDGILKAEKHKHVVKIGPMHLKGVWIPFERALEFANKEKTTEMLYPLFVHNIGALLYHPSNQTPPGRGYPPPLGQVQNQARHPGSMMGPGPGMAPMQMMRPQEPGPGPGMRGDDANGERMGEEQQPQHHQRPPSYS